MERFLERLSASKYHDNFIIKGGILVTAMVGISQRSTMDIDTSIRNENLSAEDARKIISEIIDIDLGDEMTFSIKAVENIMDEMEYLGILGKVSVSSFSGILLGSYRDPRTGECLL